VRITGLAPELRARTKISTMLRSVAANPPTMKPTRLGGGVAAGGAAFSDFDTEIDDTCETTSAPRTPLESRVASRSSM
jgi:hypothetical protein